MRRREFIGLVGGAAVWPRAALAQRQGQSPALIGWLSLQARGELLSALKDGLAAMGLKDGVDYRIEQRWSDDQFDRLALLAEELAAMRPSIIVTFPASLAAVAAKAAPASESTATRLSRVIFMVRVSICCLRISYCVMIGRDGVQNLSCR